MKYLVFRLPIPDPLSAALPQPGVQAHPRLRHPSQDVRGHTELFKPLNIAKALSFVRLVLHVNLLTKSQNFLTAPNIQMPVSIQAFVV